MALKGEAKKIYQRGYMRGRQGTKTPRVGLITPERSNNQGSNNIKKLDPEAKQEKLVELRQIIATPDTLRANSSLSSGGSNTKLPLYNPMLHRLGDRVLIQSDRGLIEVIVPELDGSPFEPNVTGRLVSDNLFKPSFQPAPKPERKRKR